MEESNRSVRGVCFGVFEVDLRSGELRKQGLKIKLQGQPIQILALLLERPGELVTREELREKLWPTDTFVDFEHGLNAAVKKLRAALEDSADNSRFVETLHRRGYRFIAPVTALGESASARIRADIPASARLSATAYRVLIAALGVVALLGLYAFRGPWRTSNPNAIGVGVMRFAITLPVDQVLRGTPALALSPDGRQLVYSVQRGDVWQLYVRSIDQMQAMPIPGTEGAMRPFFSPDGEWVGFFAGGKLKKILLRGGKPISLCDARIGRASWGSKDTIIFSPHSGSGLWRVPAAGGKCEVVTTPDAGEHESSHTFPEFLPDGNTVLFAISGTPESKIAVLSLDTGEKKILVDRGSHPRYAPSGHLVYALASSGSLLAVPYDPRRREGRGTPVPIILESVLTNPDSRAAQYAISKNGTLVYVPGHHALMDNTLVWIDRHGAAEPIAGLSGPIRWGTRLSPDGQRLALSMWGENADVWIYELSRGTLSRLTSGPGTDAFPVWSPDGNSVVFARHRQIFLMRADGSAPEQLLATSLHHTITDSWSPDGKAIAYQDLDPETDWDIWILPMEGNREPRPFVRTPFRDFNPMFSPDGRWIAYTSNESGRREVYVRPFPAADRKWQISTASGVDPFWSLDGRELFYREGVPHSGRDKMMVVAVETDPIFRPGKARVLFEVEGHYEGPYAITPDGQRFLMMGRGEQKASPTQLNVVINWFDELQSLVPTGKK
ncbi:MAG: winged helix-turn-helix domain-containing protein [Nitrospiraceae bacterium]